MTEELQNLLQFLEKEVDNIYQENAPVDTFWRDTVLLIIRECANESNNISSFKHNLLSGDRTHLPKRTHKAILRKFNVLQSCRAFEEAQTAKKELDKHTVISGIGLF